VLSVRLRSRRTCLEHGTSHRWAVGVHGRSEDRGSQRGSRLAEQGGRWPLRAGVHRQVGPGSNRGVTRMWTSVALRLETWQPSCGRRSDRSLSGRPVGNRAVRPSPGRRRVSRPRSDSKASRNWPDRVRSYFATTDQVGADVGLSPTMAWVRRPERCPFDGRQPVGSRRLLQWSRAGTAISCALSTLLGESHLAQWLESRGRRWRLPDARSKTGAHRRVLRTVSETDSRGAGCVRSGRTKSRPGWKEGVAVAASSVSVQLSDACELLAETWLTASGASPSP